MSYLFHPPYIITLVHAENLYRHSFIITDARPNIAGTPTCDRTLRHLDELLWKDVGGWQKPHSTGELQKLFKDREIVLAAVRACFPQRR